MIQSKGFAAYKPKEALKAYSFERRDVGAHDVLIDIQFCGVCHSDVHQARDEWGRGIFPMVPGHEIVGVVSQVGSAVKKFKKGDNVGVGCIVDSCRHCHPCEEGLEQFCENGMTGTYNSVERDSGRPTYGGYSNNIVVDENYVLRISPKLPLNATAPLLCAGITTYSPLRHWKVGPGQKVGIVGLGGLGHMGVKFANAFGAEVTVFSTSPSKEQDAKKLGAHHFAVTKDPKIFEQLRGQFDFILNTVSATLDLSQYLGLLRKDGKMVMVGVPEKPDTLHTFSLIMNRRTLAGSLIGGIAETQEMLDFCAEKGITADVEMISMKDINGAYDRMMKSDVKYRFVIDIASLK
jgi:uncharacterized zinc-type alcohol dehydrogenase-like protein